MSIPLSSDQQRSFDDFLSELFEYYQSNVFILGETSSGKSSLLNLLLGKEILPHRLLSCTSVICKLRYGPKLHARVVKDDDTVQDVQLDPDANPMQQLSRYIFKEDQRDDKLPYKSVEIGLPLDILKVTFYSFNKKNRFATHNQLY